MSLDHRNLASGDSPADCDCTVCATFNSSYTGVCVCARTLTEALTDTVCMHFKTDMFPVSSSQHVFLPLTGVFSRYLQRDWTFVAVTV